MAVWNRDEPTEVNTELVECPICYVTMNRKKRPSHLPGCYERCHETLEERQLMSCPFNKLHVFPKPYLNHHLEGHCDYLIAELRPKIRENGLDSIKWEKPPPEFLKEHSDEFVNDYTRVILWTFKRDLAGKPIAR